MHIKNNLINNWYKLYNVSLGGCVTARHVFESRILVGRLGGRRYFCFFLGIVQIVHMLLLLLVPVRSYIKYKKIDLRQEGPLSDYYL